MRASCKVLDVGSDADSAVFKVSRTRIVDLGGRVVIPGLIDLINAGLRYDLELRWPFIMNTEHELARAYERYQSDQMGRLNLSAA
jgi:predicted amidohydrolase YtcJ